jgi:VWFA-related protein
MGMQRIPANVLRATLVVILVLPLLAAQTIQFKRGQRIYVVAVRTVGDERLFNSCPPTHPPSGFHQSVRFSMPPVTFHAPELFSSREEIVPGGIPDAELKSRLEKEFQKQKKYQVVSSPQDADFVFLVEDEFIAIVDATIKSQDGPKPPEFPKPPIDGSNSPDIVFPPPNRGDNYFRAVPMDEKPDLLLRAFAIVVPAGLCLQNPDDNAALLKEQIWEGMITSSNNKSVSPESLVRQFDGGEKMPRGKAICTAPQPRHALPPAAIHQSQLAPKGTDTKPPASPEEQHVSADSTTLRSNVELVSVPVIVTDQDGKRVLDLKQSDFHIFEDEVEQKIDRLIPEADPLNVALLIDTSLSMRFSFDEIQRWVLTCSETLRPQDRLMVVSFNSRVYVDSELTGSRDQLLQAVGQMRAGDVTRLYDALDLAMTERLDWVSGRKAIVLFTDGVDTASGLADSAATLMKIETSDVPVYVIQFDTKQSTPPVPSTWILRKAPEDYANKDQVYARADQFLRDLSSASGGRVVQAGNRENINDAFLHISEDLSYQYTLCYYPANRSRDNAFRKIRVKVDRNEVNIQTRSGYRVVTQAPSAK